MPPPIPSLQVSLLVAVFKVAAVAQHKRGDERPEVDSKAEPNGGHLHPGGRPGVLEVLCVCIARPMWCVCVCVCVCERERERERERDGGGTCMKSLNSGTCLPGAFKVLVHVCVCVCVCVCVFLT